MGLFSRMRHSQCAIRLCLGSLVLISTTSVASAAIDDAGGIRLVGRLADGSIVLDGSSSTLAGWETPSVISRATSPRPSASELIAIGTIDSVDLSGSTITVAGQSAVLTEGTRLIDALSGTSHPLDAATKQLLGAGDHVAISGDVTGPGQSIAT